MNIAVILPSYQEVNNIAFVTKIIDKGLMAVQVKFPEIKKVVIANIDSSSPDKTSEIFRKVKTKNSKISFITKGKPGKGKNILFFLKKYQEQFDIFVMLDADLKSIKVDWIEKLISPIIRRKCDFVWPLYERSRFEGSTTNHFAYPIIYTLSGRDIRQPIAGDFAFSKKFVKKISHLSKPKGAYFAAADSPRPGRGNLPLYYPWFNIVPAESSYGEILPQRAVFLMLLTNLRSYVKLECSLKIFR